MKILINCVAAQVGGSHSVALNLAKSLAAVDKHNYYYVYAPAGVGFESLAGANIKIITYKINIFYYFWRLWYDQIYTILLCRRHQIDLMLNLSNIPALLLPNAQCLMLQQALFFDDDLSLFSWLGRLKIQISEIIFRLGLNVPDCIIVQTPVMANKLTSKYHLNPQKVAILSSGFLPSDQLYKEDKLINELFSANYFNVLCVATYYPHKNLEILLKVSEFIKAQGLNIRLFITIEKADYPGATRLLNEITNLKIVDILINLGRINKDSLQTAYQRANLFLLPTLAESYGLIYLEAMSFNCPIVTSDKDFAYYICGDAALYFDPKSAEAILAAICKIKADSNLSKRLVENGAKRLSKYFKTWEEVALGYLETMEKSYQSRHKL